MRCALELGFRAYAEAQACRILTQMDRDPHSPSYGCFDRAYWHYKTGDFASAVLQQGLALLDAVRQGVLRIGPEFARWGEWAVAAVNALSRQAGSSGRLDEYYPNEDSYPAAAFGLWAVSRVLGNWRQECPHLLEQIEWAGLRRVLARLARRREIEAANQYAAGLAALAMARGIDQLRPAVRGLEEHAERLFGLQHPEGWFPEYGGPDTGYLSVTLDALTDYLDVTGDARAAAAIERAIRFLASLVGPDGRLPSTLNSRNTDYVLPYGLVRAGRTNRLASWLVHVLFDRLETPTHWLWAADDRYHLHYLYASVLRSLPHLGELTAPEAPQAPPRLWLAGAGYFVARSPDGRRALYVAGRKGGSLRLHSLGRTPRFDHGWRIRVNRRRVWVTDWWSGQWQVAVGGDRLTIEGPMQTCEFERNSPWRQIALRIASRLLGRRLMRLLRARLIWRRRAGGPWFRREIVLHHGGFEVRDEIAAAGSRALPAPRQNLRHVASAAWFSPEELTLPLGGGRSTWAVRWEEFP